MEAIGLDLGGNINYLQDLAVSADGSNLLDIIDQNVPGYHRVTKTDPFQDPMDDEPFCCMHRQQFLTSACGVGGGLGSVTSAMCETASLDLSPNITEDFQKMYSDWQQHLGSLQASEEEDLVVDEVVSLSMSTRSTRNTSIVTSARQRTESVSSITGPCVPPDLLLDTGMRRATENESFDEVQQEDILTEIAGIDGDLPLEDCVILPDDGIISAHVKEESEPEVNTEDQNKEGFLEEEEKDTEAVEEEELATPCSPESQIEGSQHLEKTDVKPKELQAGGGFRNVAELIGNNKSQSLVCKKIKSSQGLHEKKLRIDSKDLKLRAGSIILAVVNEAGSLVPLPQLQMKNQKLARAIKVEESPEKSIEEDIDVETVTEKAPVLEAGDVDSLLAQFEASEAVNKPSIENSANVKRKNSSNQLKVIPSTVKSRRQTTVSSSSNNNGTSPQTSPTHQKIKDSLPKEIIEKIKATTKRKSTQMLSEPLAMRKGRAIRQQEVKQNRNKSVRAPSSTSGQQNSNDRVPPPLDHDYCCSPDKQKKSTDDSTSQNEGYLNKIPDYYTAKVSKREGKKTINSSDDNHDDSGKKDSGVESGDVSDASIETEDRKKDRTIKSDRSRNEWDKGKSEVETKEKNSEDVYNKLPSYMTDIGNSKPKDDSEEESKPKDDSEEAEEGGEKEEGEDKEEEKQEIKKIKRKLNLSEYRQRIQSAHSSRCPSPAQTDAMPKTPNSSTPLSIGDLIQKMKEAEEEKSKEVTNSEVPEEKSADSALPVEDVEEGELKGDSDPETITHGDSKSSSSVDSKLEKHTDCRKEKGAPFTSPSSLNSSTSSNSRESRKNSSQGYASRRWSSSSHSRSRSRSPNARKKHHSSRSSRSSRGKRRAACKSSRSSVSPCRCWSRSRSRSRGRSSSESSYCSTCSSKSRSRSRSHSAKKRDRRAYARRYSANRERRRRSRSHSRSSSRYSRSRSPLRYCRSSRRSRSPTWRNSNRSRSPPRRSFIPRRREDEDRLKQVEERRVIYVGRISEGTSKADLRRRFQQFGTIVDISVHFRERGDNYGFVTFKDKDEAYNAVENGNSDPSYPRYDLCFGGRRAFCRVQYSDLDAQDEVNFGRSGSGVKGRPTSKSDFDTLLRDAMKRSMR